MRERDNQLLGPFLCGLDECESERNFAELLMTLLSILIHVCVKVSIMLHIGPRVVSGQIQRAVTGLVYAHHSFESSIVGNGRSEVGILFHCGHPSRS